MKTLFDARPNRLGNLYPKIPDGSEVYVARLKPLHPPNSDWAYYQR